jgi:aspartyl-tRNA(Asn)/glutamyl-tRNA(Gln) amidotransferase subunit B
MPGALPVLNEHAVELAMQAAYALNTTPQPFSKFDRKHYFYPDLPKGYQITQFDQPVILGGRVDIMVDGKPKSIGITRAHLEEDAGKTTHPTGKDYSLVDLNRAGTPLLEIVSEPEIHTAAEAKAYAHELWLLMRYSGVSDADLYHGNMRFDVNVSVSKTDQLGTRTETKNLNSFKSVEKSVEYEVKRQIELLEKGEEIIQETRGWDDAKQKTFSQRSKEDAHDYRYFPDPDIPPVVISQMAIESVKLSMPTLPSEIRTKLKDLKLEPSSIETLLDEMPAGLFIAELLDNKSSTPLVKRVANWLVGDVLGLIGSGEQSWDSLKLDEVQLLKLAEMAETNKVSSTGAKTVLIELITNGGDTEEIAKQKNVLQVSDESAIAEIVSKVLSDNPQAAEDVRGGEMKAIGFLVGQVMKESKGQANPGLAQKLIKKQLGI